MFDWKILMVFAALGLVLLVGTASANLNGDDEANINRFVDIVVDLVNNFINTLKDVLNFSNMGVTVNRNVNFEADLANEIPFNAEEIESEQISLIFANDQSNITVDDKEITLSEFDQEVILSSFAGDFNVNGTQTTIDGLVRNFSSSGVEFSGELMNAKLEGTLDTLRIKEVELDEVNLKNHTGQLDVQEGLTIDVEEKKVLISRFLGNMTFTEESYHLSGKASRISDNGDNITVTVNS